MDRRVFLGRVVAGAFAGSGLVAAGCRQKQYAQVLRPDQHDMVGSHAAGSETYKPLIDEAVGKLLARHAHGVTAVGGPAPCPPRRICFVGLENKSCEELGDFKDQIVQVIDTQIVQSGVFQPVSPRYVQAGLREARLRPDELFLPSNQRFFIEVMEKQGQPFDYLLFATLTSGTTQQNADYQRDYLLTLELVDLHTGQPDKESATLRKGYHQSRLGRLTHR